MLNALKKDFNIMILREIGLDVDENGYVCDADTEIVLKLKEKPIKWSHANKGEILFSPIDNFFLMYYLFGYYIQKLAYTEERNISFFFINTPKKNSYGNAGFKENENTIYSNDFYTDSIKLGQLLLILNSSMTEIDLMSLDLLVAQNKNDFK